jgi:hypothetical protein
MKVYKSHKLVSARPMKRGDFINRMADKNPARSRDSTHGTPEDEGYLVIYNKDTPDHYESWSPKKQFDEGYTQVK